MKHAVKLGNKQQKLIGGHGAKRIANILLQCYHTIYLSTEDTAALPGLMKDMVDSCKIKRSKCPDLRTMYCLLYD